MKIYFKKIKRKKQTNSREKKHDYNNTFFNINEKRLQYRTCKQTIKWQ